MTNHLVNRRGSGSHLACWYRPAVAALVMASAVLVFAADALGGPRPGGSSGSGSAGPRQGCTVLDERGYSGGNQYVAVNVGTTCGHVGVQVIAIALPCSSGGSISGALGGAGGSFSGNSFSVSSTGWPSAGASISVSGTISADQRSARGTVSVDVPTYSASGQPVDCSISGSSFTAECGPGVGPRGCPESNLDIETLDLRNIDNVKLRYLSVSPHPYFGGNTRINGVIAIKGSPSDELKSLDLDVLENGAQVAVANLSSQAQRTLLHRRFGSGGVIKIGSPQLLFNLRSSDMGGINQTTNGNLTLEAVATSDAGDTASKTYGPVTKLVRYTGSDRYGGRDPNQGGDDWVLPSVIPVLQHFAPWLLYGDMSKMNGGPFSPHHTHGDGFDVDAVYRDGSYNARTVASAQAMLQLLDDVPWGSRIGTVYVSFTKRAPDDFWKTVANTQLADGRRACRVFRSVPGHGGHFHWRIDHEDSRGSC